MNASPAGTGDLRITRRFESSRELGEWARSAASGRVVKIGCECEGIVDRFLTRIGPLELVFCVQDAHPLPQALEMPDADVVLAAANARLYWLDRATGDVQTSIDGGSSFYTFLRGDGKSVVAIFEASVICVSSDGVVQWRRDTDLLSDYRVVGNELYVEFFDGGNERISISSGSRIGPA